MKRKSFLIILLCVAVLVIGAAALSLMRKPSVRYQVTFLPSLGGFRSDPHCINDLGQVVGTSEMPTGGVYLFVWDREQGLRPIERFDDPPHSGGVFINNRGQIAGTMADPNGNQRAFLLDANGHKQMLGALGGKQSGAESLNNKGQIVGGAEVPGRKPHVVIWEPSTEDSGQTAQDRTGSDPQTVAFAPPAGNPPGYRMTDLGYAGVGPLTCEINNNGLVVRRFGITSGKSYFMTWTRAAGSQKLDFVIDSGWPCGLNERNQFLVRARPTGLAMFGRVFHRCHQGYLWDPNSGATLLENHLSVKDILHFTVRELNSKGQIVGMMRTKDSSQIRAVLLEKTEGEMVGK